MSNSSLDSLDVLRKAFARVASSYTLRAPWQEPLARTLPPNDGTGAVPGTQGGWGAAAGFPYGVVTTAASVDRQAVPYGLVPPSRPLWEMNPGAPGFNDVDFVPYNWGTNRAGNRGGALRGSPISWEVIGPTLKSPYCHWQWTVNLGANTLTMAAGPRSSSLLGGGTLPTVTNAYNLDTVSDYDAAGGLYVVVSFTGEEFDGAFAGAGAPITAKTAARYTAHGEVFRVSAISSTALTLASTKLLSTYFDPPGSGTASVRGVTLLRPKVTRLAAFPLSLDGATQNNRVFVFLPPQRSARSELMPPYIASSGGTPECPSWTEGRFDSAGSGPAGVFVEYGSAVKLPIPRPKFSFTAIINTSRSLRQAGEWGVTVVGSPALAMGQVVRVRGMERANTLDPERALGWFEVSFYSAPALVLKRVPEVDSDTGTVYYGPGPISPSSGDTIYCESYDALDTLFTSSTLNVEALNAARLTQLIPPEAGLSSMRNRSTAAGPSSSRRVDRCALDTRPSADPGNLCDLGFRVVLYPAKSSAGTVAPDFDRPIDAASVVLDPTVTAAQYMEIDYEAGVLYLSHAPRPGAGCTVAPNGIIADSTNNPRGEVILYAACVPYARDNALTAGGIRVTVTDPHQGFGAEDHLDVYGRKVVYTPAATGSLAPGANLALTSTAQTPPPTGLFLMYEVNATTGVIVSGKGPFFYENFDAGTFTLQAVSFPAGLASYNRTANTRVVLWKESVRAITLDAKRTTDATRGDAKRWNTLRFKGGAVEYGADGSLVLNVRPTGTLTATDYLYAKPLQVTRVWSPLAAQPVVAHANGIATPGWFARAPNFSTGASSVFSWKSDGFAKTLMIPLNLPSSSSYEEANPLLKHECTLLQVEVLGSFHNDGGTPTNDALLYLVRQDLSTASPPTPASSWLYLQNGGTTVQERHLPVTAPGVTSRTLYDVWTDSGATTRLVISSTDRYHYFFVLKSNNGGGGDSTYHDDLYGLRLTWLDPGPRNY